MFFYRCDFSLLPRPIEALLELNKNVDKNFVVCEKIREYYFDGNFDVAPFVNMPISILPLVMSATRGGKINCQNAIFRMLRSMPGLCKKDSKAVEETKLYKALVFSEVNCPQGHNSVDEVSTC